MEALESAIASRASRALSLPSTNMALGRKLVAAGLSTSSQTAFDDALQQYGQVDRATRTELFERIRQHARDAAAAKRAAAGQRSLLWVEHRVPRRRAWLRSVPRLRVEAIGGRSASQFALQHCLLHRALLLEHCLGLALPLRQA